MNNKNVQLRSALNRERSRRTTVGATVTRRSAIPRRRRPAGARAPRPRKSPARRRAVRAPVRPKNATCPCRPCRSWWTPRTRTSSSPNSLAASPYSTNVVRRKRSSTCTTPRPRPSAKTR